MNGYQVSWAADGSSLVISISVEAEDSDQAVDVAKEEVEEYLGVKLDSGFSAIVLETYFSWEDVQEDE